MLQINILKLWETSILMSLCQYFEEQSVSEIISLFKYVSISLIFLPIIVCKIPQIQKYWVESHNFHVSSNIQYSLCLNKALLKF